jgi:hypothetical protein
MRMDQRQLQIYVEMCQKMSGRPDACKVLASQVCMDFHTGQAAGLCSVFLRLQVEVGHFAVRDLAAMWAAGVQLYVE